MNPVTISIILHSLYEWQCRAIKYATSSDRGTMLLNERQCVRMYCKGGSLGNLISNGGSFLGVLSKAFCALQSHLKFLQLFSGGGGSL